MKRLILASAALMLMSSLAMAQSNPKGLTLKITDESTGVDCTHWSIENDQRDHKNQRVTVSLGGYPSSATRDAKKMPVCNKSYNIGSDAFPVGKKVGDLTTADLYALIKEVKPPVSPGFVTLPAIGSSVTPPTPVAPFKDAKVE